ncbi:hypothetical protein GDO78_014547 [Eleutherodactylus coqui]|uniref:Uncharacterized protein n=1 Tax=Eleutherodactylus coqui TaxID=57060 RepID=A0A8J6ELP0_ELECQ|nr:hypothetical protein GDO78_014547 [Eleutherodactylus coqui]
MYWYQQRAGQGLNLIAMAIGLNSPTMEKDFEKNWIMSKQEAKNSSLRKDRAELQDSAVYYCASSITVRKIYGTTQPKAAGCTAKMCALTQTYQ